MGSKACMHMLCAEEMKIRSLAAAEGQQREIHVCRWKYDSWQQTLTEMVFPMEFDNC